MLELTSNGNKWILMVDKIICFIPHGSGCIIHTIDDEDHTIDQSYDDVKNFLIGWMNMNR